MGEEIQCLNTDVVSAGKTGLCNNRCRVGCTKGASELLRLSSNSRVLEKLLDIHQAWSTQHPLDTNTAPDLCP